MVAPGPERCCQGRRTNGEPCGNWPVRGARVCWKHGGSAPQVRQAAAQRVAMIKLREHLATVEPDIVDPVAAMLQQLGLAAAWERYLRAEVAALESLEGRGVGGAIKAAVLVELWNDERDRTAKIAKLAVDAGVAERQVQLAEQQGAVIADLIRRVLDDPDLSLSADQRSAASRVAARHLRAVAVES